MFRHRWVEYYVNLVKNLQPGVTEVFVHLTMDDAESQAVMMSHADWGAAWPLEEADAISSPAFRKALEDNHVTLIGWRAEESNVTNRVASFSTFHILLFRR